VKNLRKKKSDLDDLNTEFQEEIRNGAEKLFFYMSDFIDNKFDETEADEKFQEIILCEKKCDRLKEKYLELLFKEKRALPFLLQDRYKILIPLDKIVNRFEYLSRYVQVYPFEIYPELRKSLNKLNEYTFEIMNQLLNCTLLMETSFSGANEITYDIEQLRRNAHDLKFKMLDTIFSKKDEPLRVNLTWKIISLLYDIISAAEEISDFLRELIIKYPNI
jgi:predicted phosphate transport protein (TIGR00153 family)